MGLVISGGGTLKGSRRTWQSGGMTHRGRRKLAYTPAVMRARTGFVDRCIAEIDVALRTLGETDARSGVAAPHPARGDGPLTASERDHAARLMRVNHAGEIAAQALYRGQALVARDAALRAELLQAADEEHDHLRWCAERTRALGQEVSRLSPAWYLGSLAIGAVAGLAGDRVSLGFLAETERQVCEHLDGHLVQLPAADAASRAIVTGMRADELAHQRRAEDQGGVELPFPIRLGMRAAARVMTGVARYL